VHGSIAELMSDMEKLVHNCNQFFPKLLKITLVHYQFETIHPFLNGNGHVGRSLNHLVFGQQGILKKRSISVGCL
jgi:Fic family protein